MYRLTDKDELLACDPQTSFVVEALLGSLGLSCPFFRNMNTCIMNENELGFLGRFSPNPEGLGEN